MLAPDTIVSHLTILEELLMLDNALAYARQHRGDHLAELTDFLRIPSISTLPEAEPDLRAGAAWLAAARWTTLSTSWCACWRSCRMGRAAGC